jgi:hypothetical protein
MKLMLPYAIVALVVAAVLAGVSFMMTAPRVGPTEFEANLLLNVVAEFIGFGVGIVAAGHLAARATQKKIDELGKPLVQLIRQLRVDGTITSEAARAAVQAVFSVISEKAIGSARIGGIDDAADNCAVCALECKVAGTGENKRCRLCHLPGKIWSVESDPV